MADGGGPSHQTPELSVVRALDASWRVPVSHVTLVANRCASVGVSNWTLRQLYAVRRVKVENNITELKLQDDFSVSSEFTRAAH